jgi:hypothetical protein
LKVYAQPLTADVAGAHATAVSAPSFAAVAPTPA